MENNNSKVLQLFKDSVISFLDQLIDVLPSEGDLVRLRIIVKDKYSTEKIIKDFKYHLLTCKEKISNKDEEYFLQNENIFENIPKDKVLHFKKIWRSDYLNAEHKLIIWNWLDAFAKLAELYRL